jgi:dolichol-phosphate mannosyltransferase
MPDPAVPTPLISIVIPIKNEEANIAALAAEIDRAFAGCGHPWEALWIDDGSDDDSLARLQALPAPHRWLSFERNCGQSAAFACGFRQARGEWVGTLDGDGQNDPADLLRQLEHARAQQVPMVNGIRQRRQDSWVRKLSSKIGNAFRNAITGRSVSDVGCSTRVVQRAVAVELPFFHGYHRFLPTLVAMQGHAIAEIPVNHRPRGGGRSKYGIRNRLWAGLCDCFGVWWLRSRTRRWTVRASGGAGG